MYFLPELTKNIYELIKSLTEKEEIYTTFDDTNVGIKK